MSEIASTTVDYKQLLNSDLKWAFMEGSRHFDEKSRVFIAMQKIGQRLNDLHIPYAVVGGMAVFRHGLHRFTEDVDLLVTKDGLRLIHEKLDGLGYLPPHAQSKHLRDTELGVKIEFLTTGDFPGDGKPKPVAFPDPVDVSTEIEGISFVNLETLLELKLASGKSNVLRQKDLGDAVELMKVLKLPRDFGTKLNTYVQDEYFRFWDAIAAANERSDWENTE